MKRFSVGLLGSLLLVGGQAFAMDGVFDRSAEVDKYLLTINDGTRNTLTETARAITGSDIGDPRLAKALFEKLSADLPTLDQKNAVDAKYLKATIVAITSTGVQEYGEKLKPTCNTIESMKKPNYCDHAVAELDANRRKNELVNSTKYYHEGDDPRVARVMNLLMSDDFVLKLEGAHRMNWGKILDPRLMEAIAPQVLQYMNSTKHGASAAQVGAIAGYVKLLGFSGNPKYRDVLQQVRKSQAGALIQTRAKEALTKLKKPAKP